MRTYVRSAVSPYSLTFVLASTLVSLGCSQVESEDEVQASLDSQIHEASTHLQSLRSRFVVRPDVSSQRVLPGQTISLPTEIAVLHPSDLEGVERDGSRLLPRLRSTAVRPAMPARVVLPAVASGVVSVEEPSSGLAVYARLDGAHDVDAEIADGFVLYRGAVNGIGDVVQRVMPDGVEDYVAFDERPPRSELRYAIELSHGIAGLRLVANTLEFLNDAGDPRLRVAPPRGVEARGNVFDATISVDGCAVDTDPRVPWGRPVVAPGASRCTVVVEWNGADVEYPAIVDPAWTSTGNMISVRGWHGSASLANGNVLVLGGINDLGAYLKTSEIYNIGTGTWSMTGEMSGQRAPGRATLLNNGNVLTVGGQPSYQSAELYDATTGNWFNAPTSPVFCNPCEQLPLLNGNVIVIPNNSNEWALYGSTGASVVSFGTRIKLRGGFTASLLPNGQVLVAGGYSGFDGTLDTTELFDGVAWNSAASMSTPRQSHTATVLADGSVLVAGGNNGSTATAERYVAGGAGSWTSAGTINSPYFYYRSVRLPSGNALLVGDVDSQVFDPVSSSWWNAGNSVFGHGGQPSVNLLNNGKVLLAGGNNNKAEVYSLVSSGESCLFAGECASGYCVDGICCNTVCDGICQACTANKKGSGMDGVCGFVGADNNPDNDCPSNSPNVCENGTCDGAGACKLTPTGTNCTSAGEFDCQIGMCNGTGACELHPIAAGTQCGSAHCNGTAMTNPSTCDGAGTCAYNGEVACLPGYQCIDDLGGCLTTCEYGGSYFDELCDPSYHCNNGACVPDSPNGTVCNSSEACFSGQCVDGVCCDSDCSGTCMACTAARKGFGVDGVCEFIVADSDPDGECEPDAFFPQSCKADGFCDGSGQCRENAKVGTACGDTSCSSGTQLGLSCNGGGLCIPQVFGCFPYACAGNACAGSCGSDSDCAPGFYCDGAFCYSESTNGSPCTNDNACESSFCIDGVCCNTDCNGQCEACNAPGAEGQCTTIAGAPQGDRPSCNSTGDICGGTCDGINGAACTYQALVPCGASCDSGLLTRSLCDNTGQCIAQPPITCTPYACAGDGCKTSCSTDTDCESGYACTNGHCGPSDSSYVPEPQVITSGGGCSSCKVGRGTSNEPWGLWIVGATIVGLMRRRTRMNG